MRLGSLKGRKGLVVYAVRQHVGKCVQDFAMCAKPVARRACQAGWIPGGCNVSRGTSLVSREQPAGGLRLPLKSQGPTLRGSTHIRRVRPTCFGAWRIRRTHLRRTEAFVGLVAESGEDCANLVARSICRDVHAGTRSCEAEPQMSAPPQRPRTKDSIHAGACL
eukprot:361545-Chlamydomonas_euryale.AAC.9